MVFVGDASVWLRSLRIESKFTFSLSYTHTRSYLSWSLPQWRYGAHSDGILDVILVNVEIQCSARNQFFMDLVLFLCFYAPSKTPAMVKLEDELLRLP